MQWISLTGDDLIPMESTHYNIGFQRGPAYQYKLALAFLYGSYVEVTKYDSFGTDGTEF